jgi:hypothetical protein
VRSPARVSSVTLGKAKMTHLRIHNLLIIIVAFCFFGCAKKESSSTWMDPKKISQGPIIHSALSPEQIARITRVQKIFADVDPTPLTKWIEDFSRDQNPDREIAIWEGMAAPYEKFLTKYPLTPQGKKEAFQVVLIRSGASSEETMSRLKIEAITKYQAQEILLWYQTNPEPIRVYTK